MKKLIFALVVCGVCACTKQAPATTEDATGVDIALPADATPTDIAEDATTSCAAPDACTAAD